MAEIGPAGYANFQVSDDTGTDARNFNVHEKVYAAGIQAGVNIPKRMIVLNFHWFQGVLSRASFPGQGAFGLSLVMKL